MQHENRFEGGQFGPLAPYYDELMKVVPYAQWVEYVQLLWSLHDFAPRTILDAACGTGNVSFELARRGYQVTGVDLSPEMIAIAQAKILDSPLKAQIEQAQGSANFQVADLTQLELQHNIAQGFEAQSLEAQGFDGGTCLYDSLNYILDPRDLSLAFENIRRSVRAGGIWVFDMNSDWAFRANLFTQTQRDPRQALHYQWQADFDRQNRICRVDMKFQKRNPNGTIETFTETHRERAYLLEEVIEIIRQTGWTRLGAYDAYTLNRPHARSERWYFALQNQ